MKNLNRLKPLNLMFNIIVFALVFTLVGINTLWAVPAGTLTGTALSYAATPRFALFMAIQKEIWKSDIQEGLYADNKFLDTFSKADKDDIEGRTVHIPQSGAAAGVKKNRTELPATVTQRTDIPTSYQINEFTSDPMLVKKIDEAELSYDKRGSILSDNRDKLAEEVAEDVLLSVVKPGYGTTQIIPAANIISTEGANIAASAPGATAQVKAYQLGDFQRARTQLVKQKAWTEGKMFSLITADAEAQMFPANSQVTATYMAAVSQKEREAGVMYKVQGFNIMTRSSVYVLDNTGAFKPQSAATATTDVEGVLFYNGNMVEFAMGDIEVFENADDATYFGSILSYLVRCGARAKREKMQGLIVLKQSPAA